MHWVVQCTAVVTGQGPLGGNGGLSMINDALPPLCRVRQSHDDTINFGLVGGDEAGQELVRTGAWRPAYLSQSRMSCRRCHSTPNSGGWGAVQPLRSQIWLWCLPARGGFFAARISRGQGLSEHGPTRFKTCPKQSIVGGVVWLTRGPVPVVRVV